MKREKDGAVTGNCLDVLKGNESNDRLKLDLSVSLQAVRLTSTNMLSRGFLFSAHSAASWSAGGNKQQPVYTVISGQWPKSMLKSCDDM